MHVVFDETETDSYVNIQVLYIPNLQELRQRISQVTHMVDHVRKFIGLWIYVQYTH